MNLYLRLLWVALTWRRRSRHGPMAASRLRFRVHLGDLDIYRHMNNARYLALMDLGRVDLMLRSNFWQRLQTRGWFPVVAAERIFFFRSLQPFEPFWLESRVIGWDETRVYLEQRFLTLDEQVVAVGQIASRFLSKTGDKVNPEDLRTLFDADLMPESMEPPADLVTSIGREALKP